MCRPWTARSSTAIPTISTSAESRPAARIAQLPMSRTMVTRARPGPVPAVGEPTGHRRGHRAGHAGQPEQADDRVAVVKRRPGEQEGQRCPQGAEAAEAERAERHPQAQHRLLGDQGQDRAQQRAVGDAGGRRHARQRAAQHRGEERASRPRRSRTPRASRARRRPDRSRSGPCRMPISSPLMTVPTTAPRSCSADSSELSGTMI